MPDGDAYDVCCCCGTEYLVRAMRAVTVGPPPLFMCLRCHRDQEGGPDPWAEDDWPEED